MRVKIVSIIAITVATMSIQAQNSKEGLFKAKCSMCHIPSRPEDVSKLVAPPAMGITKHVKMAHPDRDGFKAFVKDYVINPSLDKALCAKHTLQRFNLMPSQKGNVTLEELDMIADYLYDNFANGKMNAKGCRGGGRMNGVYRQHGYMNGMGMHHGM